MKALALLCFASVASANPVSLRLTHEPVQLHMRPRMAQIAKPEPKPSPIVPAPDITATAPAADSVLGQVRDLRQPISVRLNLGYVVDGTALTDKTNLNQRMVQPWEFALLRAYALGEGYFSSRGVVFPSLSTYFAARFQITTPTRSYDPSDPNQTQVTVPPPIANWFDRSGFEPHAYWAEVQDFLPDKRLAPVRLRAGDIYVYGPWVMHMYGAIGAWEGKLFRATAYGGSRVPDYTLAPTDASKNRAGIYGSSARVDLTALKNPIPFAAELQLMRFTSVGSGDQDAAGHAMVQLDWRPRKDIALIARARQIEGALANEAVQLRVRYRQVTNFVFDLVQHEANDWRWDPSVGSNDPLAAKRWLDLGPSVPRLLFSARAGTLIKENVDLFVRGAAAHELEGAQQTTWNANYFELGSALEVRLRRTVALGLNELWRQTSRGATPDKQIPDIPNQIDPLIPQSSTELGERSFTELGATLRLSLGARRFSFLVEIYGRRTRYALNYCNALHEDGTVDPNCMSDVDTGITSFDYRGGGRATLDAYIGKNLRIFASYDVSSRLDIAREISGFKSLRLMLEGVY